MTITESVDVHENGQSSSTFPIIGVGASAGGLEALEAFFAAVPSDCVMAFVVVPHLSAEREGTVAELLKHRCTLPVSTVVDHEPVTTEIVPAEVFYGESDRH